MRIAKSLTALGLSLAFSLPASALTIKELVQLKRLSEPQLSPDGSLVVFTQRETDMEANKGRTDLWLYEFKTKTRRPLTSDAGNDHAARWSADGQWLYFLSTRSGSSQVWRLPLAGGEARQVTDLSLDVGSFQLPAKGERLVVSLEVHPDCQDLACTQKRMENGAKSKASGQAFDRLFLRHWDAFEDGLRSHLFSLSLDKNGKANNPVDLMRGLDGDTPSKPQGGNEDYTISPDGKTVYFSVRLAGREEPWSTNFDIHQAPIDGSARPKNLSGDNKAWDAQPVVSPDGRYLAWKAMDRPGYEADRFHIRLRDLRLGKTRDLAADWDRSVEELAFDAEGDSLYVTARDTGQKPLFLIDREDGGVRKLVAEGTVTGISVGEERVVYGWDDLENPTELYAYDKGKHGRLTRVHGDAKLKLGKAEQFEFEGAKGELVHGYVVRPADYSSGKKYPVAFLIHGGPQSSLSNYWQYRWNPQIYAGAGYAVVAIDFHGSVGYGQKFTDSIQGNWGGAPLEDLQKGLAAAAKQYGFLDGNRACALGGSYGGYMTNWIAGQWKDRFKCLVNHAGIFDQRTFYYSTEELWFPEWEQLGPHYDKPEEYSTWNPIRYVGEWKTPMLVIHGQLDYRIPVEQGIATFTALQRRNVPSKFLYFPDENHWILKPNNSIQWHNEVLAWLDKWTKK
ncbi:MAG: S9 family peptidase [Gammaproteobacteria bacterium]|nr:S9 family peptidase [Gammaproteobacteria bacterium]